MKKYLELWLKTHTSMHSHKIKLDLQVTPRTVNILKFLTLYSILSGLSILTLVLLNPDIPCLCKQCRSRSVGFWRSQLIWICTVCHLVCVFIATIQIKKSDWLKIRSGRGILIYSAGQGLRNNYTFAFYTVLLFTQLLLKILSGMEADWSGSALFAYAILSENLLYEILGHLP